MHAGPTPIGNNFSRTIPNSKPFSFYPARDLSPSLSILFTTSSPLVVCTNHSHVGVVTAGAITRVPLARTGLTRHFRRNADAADSGWTDLLGLMPLPFVLVSSVPFVLFLLFSV